MTGLVIVTTGVWDDKRPLTLGMGETQAYDAELFRDASANEAARIQGAADRIAAAKAAVAEGRADEASRALLEPREVTVEGGKARDIVFVGREGVVEDAEVLSKDAPLSGVLRLDPAATTLTGAAPDLRLRGAMLHNSSALTAWAFERGLSPLGNWGSLVVTFSVFLFALSTVISWSYYGDRCVEYLVGARYVIVYRIVYTLIVFVGSVSALEVVWAYGDLALGLMAVPNLLAVILLTPKVVTMTRDYFARMDAAAEAESSAEEP
jgi:AGCS family alanine or glycine:cation symporter